MFTEMKGWMGLRWLNLGYDRWIDDKLTPGTKAILQKYLDNLGTLEGADPVTTGTVSAYRFEPKLVIDSKGAIIQALTNLVNDLKAVLAVSSSG